MHLVTKAGSFVSNAYRKVECDLLTGTAGKVTRAVKATVMSLPALCSSLWAKKNEFLIVDQVVALTGSLCKGVTADTVLFVGTQSSFWIVKATIGGTAGCLGMVLASTATLMGVEEILQKVGHDLLKKMNAQRIPDNENIYRGLSVFVGLHAAEGLVAGAHGNVLTPAGTALMYGGSILMQGKEETAEFSLRMLAPNAAHFLLGGFFGSATIGALAYDTLSSLSSYLSPLFSPLYASNQDILEAQLCVTYFGKAGVQPSNFLRIIGQYLALTPPDPREQTERAEALSRYSRLN